MNLKTLFAALLVSFCSVLSSYSMGDEPVVIVLSEDLTGSPLGPRTGVPISACIDDCIITTTTNTYSGTISVVIKDEDGDTVFSTVENVSVNSQFTTNVTSLADGTYTIYYTLDNNSVYYGDFEKN